MLNVYNKKNAAKAIGVSTCTLDRYRRNGKLPYHQIGDRIVFTENDLLAFLGACAITATSAPSEREKLEMSKTIGGLG
jgi:predicted site-specific integrase-resolvase